MERIGLLAPIDNHQLTFRARAGFFSAWRGSSAKPLNTRMVCSEVVSCRYE